MKRSLKCLYHCRTKLAQDLVRFMQRKRRFTSFLDNKRIKMKVRECE